MSQACNTHKLGPIQQQPANSPFSLKRRMPGWYPDAAEGICTKGGREELFLEEALQLDTNQKFHPFPVEFNPLSNQDWTFGGPVPDTKNDFCNLIRALADVAREFNASLYRLRRLHYFAHSGNDPQYDKMPPDNPDDDLDPTNLPDKDSDKFQLLVCRAEQKWKEVTCRFDKLICNQPDQKLKKRYRLDTLKILAVDMVEVNNYIISIRLVTRQEPSRKAQKSILEVGGSSSHFSISSAFSSPSQ